MKHQRIWMTIGGFCVAAIVLATLAALWLEHITGNIPIHYYGRVVDTNGKPIAGVTLEALVTIRDPWQIPIRVGWDNLLFRSQFLVTDAGGNFEVKGASGINLQIRDLHHDGYKPWPRPGEQYGASFERYSGDEPRHGLTPDDPSILQMKADGA
jgi:hypothetical protein